MSSICARGLPDESGVFVATLMQATDHGDHVFTRECASCVISGDVQVGANEYSRSSGRVGRIFEFAVESLYRPTPARS